MANTLYIDDSAASKVIQVLITYLGLPSESISVAKLEGNTQNSAFGLTPVLHLEKKTLSGASAIALWLVTSDAGFVQDFEHMIGSRGLDSCKVYQWLNFGPFMESLTNKDEIHRQLAFLNENITRTTFFLDGVKPTLADIFLFVYLHPVMAELDSSSRVKYAALTRWFDCMQHLSEFDAAQSAGTFPLPMVSFDLNTPFTFQAFPEPKSKGKKSKQQDKKQGKEEKKGKQDQQKKDGGDQKQRKKEKKQKDKKPKPQKQSTVDVSLLDIRVGQITQVKPHPDADSLYVEEINLGEETRTVVSGLVKHVPLDKMQDAKVLVATNLKPAKMRGIESRGMVLCGSSADHSSVVLLDVPEGAKIGEKVSFPGFDGEPGANVNKKKLDKILPDFVTTEDGTCKYKDAPFTTSAGVVKAAITNGHVG